MLEPRFATQCVLSVFFVFLDVLLVSSTLLFSSTLLSSIHQYTDKNKSVILFLVTRINIAGTHNT